MAVKVQEERDDEQPQGAALFPQEQEPEPERERAGTAEEAPPVLSGKFYTAEQISTLQEAAREAGAAEALGRLLGRRLLDADGRAQAIELLFGPRGRKHQKLRPLVEAAAASDDAPARSAGALLCAVTIRLCNREDNESISRNRTSLIITVSDYSLCTSNWWYTVTCAV